MNQRALSRLGWKLGCQAWTFRSLSVMDMLDTLHALGIHYVEFYPGQRLTSASGDKFGVDASQAQIDQVLARCKADEITPMSFGVVGLSNDEAEARKVFEFAKKLNLKNIVSEPPEEALSMIDRLAAEYHMNVAIHDHPKPSHYWNCDTLVKALKGHSHRIGACADVGHWYRSGMKPLDCLKKLRGHIIELHFKDISSKTKEDVPWGTGACDVPAMLAEIKHQKIHPLFAIEYESGSGAELISNVSKSIEFFSEQATQLAK